LPGGNGFSRFVSRAGGVSLALALSCASTPWPDEPGVPVELGRAANVEAGDSFLSALTAAREARGLAPPLVTPRYQSEIRTFADDLQAGKTSAAGARRAIEGWGRVAYQHSVESWLVDCTKGTPQVPPALGELSSAVMTYAGAHFRPRSMAADQCVVLIVAPTGAGEAVHFAPPAN
jgi:hypothetical protein